MKRDRFAVGLTTKDGRGGGPEEVIEAEVVNIQFLKLTHLKPDLNHVV